MKIKDLVLIDLIEDKALGIASEVTGTLYTAFDAYDKVQFNIDADCLKKKYKREFYGRAVILLSLIREFNLITDSRCYNLLRHIEDTFGPK